MTNKTLQQKIDAIYPDIIKNVDSLFWMRDTQLAIDKALQEFRQEIEDYSFSMSGGSRAIMLGIVLDLIGKKK